MRLFPSIEVVEEEESSSAWLGVFEKRLCEEETKKGEELAEVRVREEQFSQDAENLRRTLMSTVSL